jgi:5-methylcytosine-specific restriction endonuclease McrA
VAFSEELNEIRPLVQARANGICEVCHFAPLAHIHHKLRRSQGGGNELSNLLGVCLDCHDFIHRHPEQSYMKGYLRKRT